MSQQSQDAAPDNSGTLPLGQRRAYWLESDAACWLKWPRWVPGAAPASLVRFNRWCNRELVFLSTVPQREPTSARGPRAARARERRLGGGSRGVGCFGSAGGLFAVVLAELGGCGRRERQGAK